MVQQKGFFPVMVMVFWFLSGCAGAVPETPDPALVATSAAATLTAEEPTSPPPTEVPSTETPVPTPEVVLAKEYSDPLAGYSFRFPGDWRPAYQESQPRGGFVQFAGEDFVLDPQAGGLPEEEILFQAALFSWDPGAALNEYTDMRLAAWENSGVGVEVLDRWSLPGERPAVHFRLTGLDGGISEVILTTVGQQYLEFSTSAEFPVLPSIADSLQTLE